MPERKLRLKPIRIHRAPKAKSRRKRAARRLPRRVLVGALAAAALAVVVALLYWTHYQQAHVISRNASVKGAIADVGAQLAGVVTAVEVQAGQAVHAGQVLVRFEDRQLQATAQSAQSHLDKGSLELEVERLAIVQESKRLQSVVEQASARLAAADAQVEAAKSKADEAKDRYDTRLSLAREGVIPQQELRDAESALRTADALLSNAQAEKQAAAAAHRAAQVELEGLAVRQERVAVLVSEIKSFTAELAVAKADLESAVITAPADGWVVNRIVEPGESVVVGQPIMSLWIGGGVWVEAWIEEQDLAHVSVGSEAQVKLKPYPDREFSGRVETIAVSTDYELPETEVPQPRNERLRGTPVVCVRIRLDEPEGLFPGLSAVVAIRKGDAPPKAASAQP